MKPPKVKEGSVFYFMALTLIAVFLAHWISDITGLESWSVANGAIGWIVLFAFYTLAMIIAHWFTNVVLVNGLKGDIW